MTVRDKQQAHLDERGNDLDEAGSDSGGQSGDDQGLTSVAEAAAESVQELADTGQDYEAEIVAGLADAADHPEEPARTHADEDGSAGSGPDHDSRSPVRDSR